MAVEPLTDRLNPDRSQQIVKLLADLSDRLRKAEVERDLFKRELLTIRECIQDLNDQSDQTQKALLASQNKFDSTENNVEGTMRRLIHMEEMVDKQSGELLGILRKIEERFDGYDREYKNHAASITHYGDTLDRFDKKLEKLMQDKGRLARKMDALEFELADMEARVTGAPRVKREIIPPPPAVEQDRPALNVWTPEAAQPEFAQGPADPMPPTRIQEFLGKMRTGAPVIATWTVMVMGLAALAYGAGMMLKDGTVRDTVAAWTAPKPEGSVTTAATSTDTAPAPVATTTPPAAATVVKTDNPAPSQDFFSGAIRAQMDAQMVEARKLEDQDAARLVAENTGNKTLPKVDQKLPRALAAIETKARDGSAEAQHDLGALYTSGQSGVAVDYARAADWFRLAAQNGVANARYNLGVLYQQGLGVTKDMGQALSWYRSASLLEHPEARYNLGIAYVEGIGVAYNPAMAAGYFEQAARAGVVEAAYNLGLILENGLIDEPRPYEGLFWFKLASDGGSDEALRAFARLKNDLNVADPAWQTMYGQMLSERPDLKRLAESRQTRSISLVTNPPTVRVVGANGQPIDGRAARVTPPPAPAVVSAPAPATPKVVVADSMPANDRQTVARIQAMLQDTGLYRGPADGLYGPRTAAAIRAYQQQAGLPVDGRPSTDLMARMIAARLNETVQPAAE